MKKREEWRRAEFIRKIPGIRLNDQEREALQAAVEVQNRQNEKLGLLDPLEAEPATIFSAEEGKR